MNPPDPHAAALLSKPGRTYLRCPVTGTVVKIGLGIPSYRQEGEVGTPSYRLVETGRAPAVEVRADGHEPMVHEALNIVAVEDLEIIE